MNISLYQQEVQNWIHEIQKNRGRDPKLVIKYCEKLEEYGQKVHDDALIGFACFSQGETYYLLNDMKNFYTKMLACLGPMEKIGEWGYLAMANNMLGIMSLNRGNAPFAMDYYMKAMSYCQTYKLPDLEWMIHMNVGSLNLNIGDYQKALDHLEMGYHYIIAHPEREDYYQNLTSVYLGMAKAYLRMDDKSTAETYSHKMNIECRPNIDALNIMVMDCFQARLFLAKRQMDECNAVISKVNQGITEDIPIMDIFDDLYDYMEMLIRMEKMNDFINIYEIVEKLAKQTAIKNMQKKLLSLKIQYYKLKKDDEATKEAALLFYELTEQMEKENHMMMMNMIRMRSSLNDLVQINREVEREDIALHRKSETDALTGLYNRFKLNEYGEDAFQHAIDKKKSLAIEILDIDYFKEYNDNYGHQAGDGALQTVADMLLRLKRHGNIFCSRYGGDEFVVIYEGFEYEEIQSFAEELKNSILQQNLEHKFSKASDRVTISQGICWGVPKEEYKVWDYLHTADELLYEVKKVSRNSIRVGKIENYMRQKED